MIRRDYGFNTRYCKKSGYAISTVSRYINQSGYVSFDTGLAIQKVIDDFDYVPNQTARDLSLGKTHRIGVVIPHTKHPYFIELVRGLLDRATETVNQLLFLPSGYDKDKEKYYLEQLRSKAFDALIFTSREIEIDEVLKYSKYGKIIVLEDCLDTSLSSIFIERSFAYDMLFKWLKKHKISKIAMLFSRDENSSPTFKDAMRSYRKHLGNIPFKTFGNISNVDDGMAIFSILKNENFDCVLATSDDIAVSLIEKYRRNSDSVPLVVSQEQQLSGKVNHIPSLYHPTYEMGRLAFELTIQNENKHLSLSSKFIC